MLIAREGRRGRRDGVGFGELLLDVVDVGSAGSPSPVWRTGFSCINFSALGLGSLRRFSLWSCQGVDGFFELCSSLANTDTFQPLIILSGFVLGVHRRLFSFVKTLDGLFVNSLQLRDHWSALLALLSSIIHGIINNPILVGPMFRESQQWVPSLVSLFFPAREPGTAQCCGHSIGCFGSSRFWGRGRRREERTCHWLCRPFAQAQSHYRDLICGQPFTGATRLVFT